MKLKQVLAGILSAAMVVTSVPMYGGGVAKVKAATAGVNATEIAAPELQMRKPAEGAGTSAAVVTGVNVPKKLRDMSANPVTIQERSHDDPNVGDPAGNGLTQACKGSGLQSWVEPAYDADGGFKGQFFVSRSDSRFSTLNFTTDPFVVELEMKPDSEMANGAKQNVIGIFNEQYALQLERNNSGAYNLTMFAHSGNWPTAKSTSVENWTDWKKVVARFNGSTLAIGIVGENNNQFGSANMTQLTEKPTRDFCIGYNDDKDFGERGNSYTGWLRNVKFYSEKSVDGQEAVLNATDLTALGTAIEESEVAPTFKPEPVPAYTAQTTWTYANDVPLGEADTTFEAGITYKMTTVLTAGREFKFTEESKPDKITYQGGSESLTLDKDADVQVAEDGSTMTITKDISVGENLARAGKINVSLKLPKSGTLGNATIAGTETNRGNYSVTTEWFDENGNKVTEVQAGTDLKAVVTLTSTKEEQMITTEDRDAAMFRISDEEDRGSSYVVPDAVELTEEGKLVMTRVFSLRERTLTYFQSDVAEDGTVELSSVDKDFYNGTSKLTFSVLVKYASTLAEKNKNYALVTLTDGGEKYMTVWHNPSTKTVSYSYEGGSAKSDATLVKEVVDDQYYKLVFSVEPNNTTAGMAVAGTTEEGSPRTAEGAVENDTTVRRFLFSKPVEADVPNTRWQVSKVLIGKKASGESVSYTPDVVDSAGVEGIDIKVVEIANKSYADVAGVKKAAEDRSSNLQKILDDEIASATSTYGLENNKKYTESSWSVYSQALSDAGQARISSESMDSAICDRYAALKAAEAALVPLTEVSLERKLTGVTLTATADSAAPAPESEHENCGPAAAAVDGKLETYWHSAYDADPKPITEESKGARVNNNFYINLNTPSTIKGVSYVPYIAGYDASGHFSNNGIIKKCQIYTSTAEAASAAEVTDWTAAAAEEYSLTYMNEYAVSSNANKTRDRNEKKMFFDQPVDNVRWVKIEVLGTDGNNTTNTFDYISASEFYLYTTDELVTSETDREKAELLASIKNALDRTKDDYDEANLMDSFGRRSYADFEDAYEKVAAYLEDADVVSKKEQVEADVTELLRAWDTLKPIIQEPKLSVKLPVIGQLPVDAVMAEETLRYGITGVHWTYENGRPLTAGTTFEEGSKYKEIVTLTAWTDAGQLFKKGESEIQPGSKPAGVESVDCAITEDGSTMVVTYTFVAKTISTPVVEVSTAPELNGTPNDVQIKVDENAYYEIDGAIEWSQVDAAGDVTKFEYSSSYRAKVKLKIKAEKEVLFAADEAIPGTLDNEVAPDLKSMTLYLNFDMPGLVRWKGKGNKSQEAATKKFFNSLLNGDYPDLVFDTVFKFDEAPTAENKTDPVLLLTLVSDSGPHFDLWIRPNTLSAEGEPVEGKAGFGFGGDDGKEDDDPQKAKRNPAFRNSDEIKDTAWHKATLVFAHDPATDGYKAFAYIDGQSAIEGSNGWEVTDSVGEGTPNGKSILDQFFSFATPNYKIAGVYVGGTTKDVGHLTATMKEFPGTIGYLSIRQEKDADTDVAREHEKASADILAEYNELKTTWDAEVTADNTDGEYTAETWATFKTEYAAVAKDKTKEWEVYNAVEAIKAAADKLVSNCACTLTIEEIEEQEANLGTAKSVEKNVAELLTGKVTSSKDNCDVHKGLSTASVTYKYEIADGSADATINTDGTKLVLKEAGTVTVNVTASYTGKKVTRAIVYKVTSNALEELKKEIASAKDAYKDPAGFDPSAWRRYSNALQNAEDLLKESSISESDIAQARGNLASAIQNLGAPTGNYNIQTSYWDDQLAIVDGDVTDLSKQEESDTWRYQVQKKTGEWEDITHFTANYTPDATEYPDANVEGRFGSTGATQDGDLYYGGVGRTNITPCLENPNGGTNPYQAVAYTWVKKNGTLTGDPEYAMMKLRAAVKVRDKNDVTLRIEQEANPAEGATAGKLTTLARETLTKGTTTEMAEFFGVVKLEDIVYLRLVADVADTDVYFVEPEIVSVDVDYEDYARQRVWVANDMDTEDKKPSTVAAMDAAREALEAELAKEVLDEDQVRAKTDALDAAIDAVVVNPECTCTVTVGDPVITPLTDGKIEIADVNTPVTITVSATVTTTKECEHEEEVIAEGGAKSYVLHKDTTDSYTIAYEASGAGVATGDNNTYTVSEAGNLTLTAKASYHGKEAQKAITVPVETAKSKALDDVIEQATSGDYEVQGDWSKESWEALQEVIAAANTLKAQGSATEEDLQKAAEAITDALSKMKTQAQADKEQAEKELQDLITEAQGMLDDEKWTPESREALRKASNEAVDVYNNDNHTLEQLTDAKQKVQAAIDALKLTSEAAIEKAQGDLKTQLAEAKKVYDAGKGTCPDTVWNAFVNAYNEAVNGQNGTDAAALTKLYTNLKDALAKVNAEKSKQPGPSPSLPAVGSVHTVGKLVYQVKTSTAASKTAMVMKATSKTQKKITIPATVKIDGQAYKVVEIKANAFAKSKKLTTVKIGANVTKIGKKAFFKCAKLKNVNIKAKKLKTIGKNAFAKINKKATIKVPKKQKKTLQKKLKKAKTIRSAKIK